MKKIHKFMSTQIPSILKFNSADGEFRRQVSSFRNIISKSSTLFPPEPHRYHLYVSLACPWAHRTTLVRALKGLEDVISLSVVDYLMGTEGWHFSNEPGAIPDTLYGVKYIKELYFKADPNYSARFTVPILWDKKTETIVNNESSEIIRMLNREFDEYAKFPLVDLYPSHVASEIDGINEWIYSDINNGVYKTGFATNQQVYETHHNTLFKAMDRVECILSTQSFLVANQITEADIRLFTTLVRFDPVYHSHFKCSAGTITHNYPHILKWLKRIYQMPFVSDTVNMEHIKGHYYKSHVQINPTQIVPVWNGPDLNAPIDE